MGEPNVDLVVVGGSALKGQLTHSFGSPSPAHPYQGLIDVTTSLDVSGDDHTAWMYQEGVDRNSIGKFPI